MIPPIQSTPQFAGRKIGPLEIDVDDIPDWVPKDPGFYDYIREKERQRREHPAQIPLQIPVPRPDMEIPRERNKREDKPTRGVTTIDYIV